MVVPRREHVGTAAAARMTAPLTQAGLSITADALTNWPTGGVGVFVVTIDRGLATEEKVICSGRNGNSLTIATGGRGFDGTAAVAHAVDAVIEHTYSATEADEANVHILATADAHVPTGSSIVGTNNPQTLTHKTLDFAPAGGANVATNLPRSASPEIDAALTAEQTARGNADTAETNARTAADTTLTTNLNSEVTNRTNADAAHVAAADPHSQYLNQARGDARYAPVSLGTDLPPIPVTANGPAQNVTATAYAALPNAVKQTVVFAHDCWVLISYGAWMAISDTQTGADIRCGVKIDAAAPGSTVGAGEILILQNTATLLSTGSQQMAASIIKKVLAGSHTFEVVAQRNAATNVGAVNYAYIEVIPLRWG